MISLSNYNALIENRPFKFGEEDVGYRKAEPGEEQCRGCLHFYKRTLDGFGVCEIMRSERTDEEGVTPTWNCRYQTVDSKKFPLLKEN